MKSKTTDRFRRCLEALPESVREQAREAYRRFEQNPEHPSLRFKRVHGETPIYSVRVSLNHRALGIRHRDTIVWFWIGSHDEYERLIRGYI